MSDKEKDRLSRYYKCNDVLDGERLLEDWMEIYEKGWGPDPAKLEANVREYRKYLDGKWFSVLVEDRKNKLNRLIS